MWFEFWCQIQGVVGSNPSLVHKQVTVPLLPKSLICVVGITISKSLFGEINNNNNTLQLFLWARTLDY